VGRGQRQLIPPSPANPTNEAGEFNMPTACHAPATPSTDTPDDMAAWIETARKRGENDLDQTARGRLVTKNIGWLRKLAGQHARQVRAAGDHCEREELESEAFVAAVEAAKFYDPDLGIRFVTYVSPWVRTALIRFTDPRAADKAGPMEFPDSVGDREDGPTEFDPRDTTPFEAGLLRNLSPVNAQIVRLFAVDGLAPSRIAEQLDMTPKDVRLELANAARKIAEAVRRGESIDAAAAGGGALFTPDQLADCERDAGGRIDMESLRGMVADYLAGVERRTEACEAAKVRRKGKRKPVAGRSG
jgi:RNA polymerase sigma factor (sigma-70 family)